MLDCSAGFCAAASAAGPAVTPRTSARISCRRVNFSRLKIPQQSADDLLHRTLLLGRVLSNAANHTRRFSVLATATGKNSRFHSQQKITRSIGELSATRKLVFPTSELPVTRPWPMVLRARLRERTANFRYENR